MILTEKNYVEKAEKAISELKSMKNRETGKPVAMVTTTRIRALLSMSADIYNEILDSKEELDEKLCGRIDYLKVRILYEAGKEETVRAFVEKTELLSCIDEVAGSRKNYILFSRYMEALVAYHRYYGGRDN